MNDSSRNLAEFQIDNYFPINWRIHLLWRSREKDREQNLQREGLKIKKKITLANKNNKIFWLKYVLFNAQLQK